MNRQGPGTPSRYAHVEREVRFRLPAAPDLPASCRVLVIEDRYLTGTRLRLRRVQEAGQPELLKLGQKVRLDVASPTEVAHTSLYLTGPEHDVLAGLPARTLVKTRRLVPAGDGLQVAVDVFAGALAGLVTAEVDLGDRPGGPDVASDRVRALAAGAVEVTLDERYTGAALAAVDAPPPWPAPEP